MGFTKTETDRQYATVREGKYYVNQGRGKEALEVDTAEGALKSLSIYDKVVPGYGDKTVLRVVLVDEGQELHIEAGQASTFSRMLAGYLHDIKQGEHIRLRIKANDRNEKATSCFVERLDQTGYHKVDYKSLKQEPGEAVATAAKIIREHEAYEVYVPKSKDAESSNEKARFLSVISLHHYPPFAINKVPYMAMFSRALQVDVTTFDDVTEDGWAMLADLLMKKGPEKTLWPKEIRDLEEYDPFADD